jgi:hypothetical protein
MQPKFRLVHPNAKNTGSLVEMTVRPANELESGYMMVSFVPQKTVGSFGNGQRVLPSFDYEKKVVVKLNIFEVGQIVDVFDGMCESIADGNGLFHKSVKGSAVVGLTHKIEPSVGYWFSVKRKPVEGDEQKVGIFITANEGRTMSIILKNAMFLMGFGVAENWTFPEQKDPQNK